MRPPMIFGPQRRLLRARIWLDMIRLTAQKYPSPKKSFELLWALNQEREKLQGKTAIKYAKSQGRYFWDFNSPGWPSASFDGFMERELVRVDTQSPTPLQTVILAITKKCPLRCEHCSEWEVLNQREVLRTEDLQKILGRFLSRGFSQLWLSGGEPLLRFDDVLLLSEQASKSADVWVLTSGYQLTGQKVGRMVRAGVTGVVISLDHWDAKQHDAFRSLEGSFAQATQGARFVREADLLLTLSLCPTKTFVTKENLWRYAQLAKDLGASFIHLIEPRAVGHYAGKDVALSGEQQRILEEFYLSMNYDKQFYEMPLVSYQNYHQRRLGCLGAGERYLYVDTNGDLQACPFCQEKAANVLEGSLEESLAALRSRGCGLKSSDHLRRRLDQLK